ncbi:MAG: segregation/condensation protein A [Blastocatellia bacterium]|nr:segregation/condensation protein A [Blastocatellia bacterium]
MATHKEKIAPAKPDELGPDDDTRRDNYSVKLEAFEGPLDLLLYLIKKDEIDIYDIPIARITKQYLEYIQLLDSLNIEVAGDFLVMAATLIYIKSKMLLPPEPKVEGEEDLNEDPRAELVGQLLEYQKFKSAANMLYEKAEIEGACYTRGSLETDKNNPEVTATVVDLLRVFKEILDRAKAVKEVEIQREEMSMSEKLTQIRTMLIERHELNVRDVFELASSKRELILTFLAFLELVKESQIILIQSQLFGEIIARLRDNAPPMIEVVNNSELAVNE